MNNALSSSRGRDEGDDEENGRRWHDGDCNSSQEWDDDSERQVRRPRSDPNSSPSDNAYRDDRLPSNYDQDQFPSSHEGLPESVALDDSRSFSGYHSSGALSDGPYSTLSSTYEHSYNATSFMRSGGSVGSHGSTDRFTANNSSSRRYRDPPVRDMIAAHLMNGETRFPSTMSYAASETAKSDIATVCSGSIGEDMELASVLSGDMNLPPVAGIKTLSPLSLERSLERASSTGSANRQSGTGARVEFASVLKYASIRHFKLPLTSPPTQRSSHFPQMEGSSAMVMLNDMGPPLSRGLLMQQAPAHGSSSRPGSVKSFGSTAGGSDVVAHVDTDDCGGSLIESVTDGNSIHSQEDNQGGMDEAEKAGEEHHETHPLLKNGNALSYANGRTSPGGTVYKGRGVRRYQGRYMHLPLKRFHQNGVSMNVGDEPDERDRSLPMHRNGFTNGYFPHIHDDEHVGYEHLHHYHRGRNRSHSPTYGDRRNVRSPGPRGDSRHGQASPDERRNNSYRHQRSWSRSRSRSRSPPPPTRNLSHSPRGSSNHRNSRRRPRRENSANTSKSPVRRKSQRSRGERQSHSGSHDHHSQSPLDNHRRSPCRSRQTSRRPRSKSR